MTLHDEHVISHMTDLMMKYNKLVEGKGMTPNL